MTKIMAASLNMSDPNMTWEQVVQKYSEKGFQGDSLYQEIINAAQRSRTIVNESLGIKNNGGWYENKNSRSYT